MPPNEVLFPLKGRRVWVAGHRGMVGSALVRRLAREDCEIVTVERRLVDLRDPHAVAGWVRSARPDAVFLAAAKVGGIAANDSRPAEFLYDNLMIAANVIEASRRAGVEKLLFLGSSCIYPRLAPQPIKEEALLAGPLEPTNQWYAVAKIAGLKLAEACRRQYGCDFISAMPTNLYGPDDNFDLESSHVLPALIARAHRARVEGARTLALWGTGAPRREFLHVDDCADALVFLMQRYSDALHVNVGSGVDISIRDLAALVCEVAGFRGEITLDPGRPDGAPRKLMDVERLRTLGWSPRIPLREGVEATYHWYRDHVAREAAAE